MTKQPLNYFCLFALFFATLAVAACARGQEYVEEKYQLVQSQQPMETPHVVHNASFGRWKITQVRKIELQGFFMAPRFADTSDQLLVTGVKYKPLYLVTSLNRPRPQVHLLTQRDYAGYTAFVEDGRLFFHDRTMTKFAIDLNDRTRKEIIVQKDKRRNLTPEAINGCRFFQEQDTIWCEKNSQILPVTHPDDKYFNPKLSPNRKILLYEGLASGIHLMYMTTEKKIYVGPGNHPCFHPNSSLLVFDRSQDNGLEITQSELYAYELGSGATYPLTRSAKLKEMHPHISPDGNYIAFDSEGSIYVGNLVWQTTKSAE